MVSLADAHEIIMDESSPGNISPLTMNDSQGKLIFDPSSFEGDNAPFLKETNSTGDTATNNCPNMQVVIGFNGDDYGENMHSINSSYHPKCDASSYDHFQDASKNQRPFSRRSTVKISNTVHMKPTQIMLLSGGQREKSHFAPHIRIWDSTSEFGSVANCSKRSFCDLSESERQSLSPPSRTDCEENNVIVSLISNGYIEERQPSKARHSRSAQGGLNTDVRRRKSKTNLENGPDTRHPSSKHSLSLRKTSVTQKDQYLISQHGVQTRRTGCEAAENDRLSLMPPFRRREKTWKRWLSIRNDNIFKFKVAYEASWMFRFRASPFEALHVVVSFL